MTELVEIMLGGFEVFDKPIRIPTRRLTFLFGPNSAGKSSLESAIGLLSEICDSNDPAWAEKSTSAPFDCTAEGRTRALRRVWRKVQEHDEGWVSELTLGATVQDEGSNLFPLEDYPDNGGDWFEAQSYHCPQTLEVQARFHKPPIRWDGYNHPIREDLVLLMDGQPFLELLSGVSVGTNFGHPALGGAPIPDSCKVASIESPSRVRCADGWVRFIGEGISLDATKALDLSAYETAWIHGWEEGPERPTTAITAALHEFGDRFNRLLRNALGHLHKAMHYVVVEASRNVPEESELSFVIGKQSNLNTLRQGLKSNNRYARLAASFVAQERGALATHDRVFGDNGSYAERVNRIFTDSLFIERGYFLTARTHALIELSELQHKQSQKAWIEHALEAPVLVTLHLEDSHGRSFSFEEVGSGLGYVLPVLAGVCDRQSSIVVVQQPELHLHPALQAQLGDALLEEAVGGRCLIVETHSEHLLLRVLRRLRNQSTVKSIGRYFEPEDVAVLYFEPHPDGTTQVKRLRIGADGDFLDAWPRGFFADRDVELFDE